MRKRDIYIQILALKSTRREYGNNPCSAELIRTTGYVNIIDMLLLPLYYSWERLGLGTLEDVCFETYLTNAYKLFCHSALSYIRQLLVLLRRVSNIRDLSQVTKSMIVSLIRLYSTMIII